MCMMQPFKGDKLAQDIFDFTGTILGEAIADFIAFSQSRNNYSVRWTG